MVRKTLEPQPIVHIFNHTSKKYYHKTYRPKYKKVSIDGSTLTIDEMKFKLKENGYGYEYVYKINKTCVSVQSIKDFTKFLEDCVWNAESAYPFEYLFDTIIKNVKPITD